MPLYQDKITSSILLDLLLALSAETDESVIVQKSARLYLRKLNCFVVSIYTCDGGTYQLKGQLPANLKENAVLDALMVEFTLTLTLNSPSKITCFERQDAFYYIAPIHNYGCILLGRRMPFSDTILKELAPILDNLGKALSLAKSIGIRDEMEKKNAGLIENLNLFLSFIQSTKDSLQVADAAGRIVFLNREACSRLGIDPSEITQHHVWDFEPLFRKPGAWEAHVAELRVEKQITIESLNLNVATGKEIPIEVTVNFEEINGQEYVIALSRDITERKRADKLLKRREQMLLAISKSTNILIGGQDVYQSISKSLSIIGESVQVDRTYLFTNYLDPENGLITSQRAEWNSGNAEPQIDNPDLQNIPFDVFDDFRSNLEIGLPFISVIRRMQPSALREILEAQSILSIVIIPIFHNDLFWGFVGFDDCQEERMWTEAEISILQTYVTSIQNALEREENVDLIKSMALFPMLNPDPVIRINLFGEIILQNDSAAKISGFIINGEPSSKDSFFSSILDQIPVQKESLQMELQDEDNQFYFVLCKYLEDIRQINIYFSNITIQKRTEAQLIEAKIKAEESDRSKEEFITNVSHEMRTPLHAIIGLSEQLLKRETDAEKSKSIRHVSNSGKHLQSLIDNILDFSKISSGQFNLNLNAFRFLDSIEQIKSIIDPIASEKNIAFTLALDPRLPKALLGDEMRLRQILLNILSNAVKFTEKGFVKLEISLLSQKKSKCTIVFSVEDSGVGMSPTFLQNIFQKFTQEDASKIRNQGGTGLGMAITKVLVEEMHGVIHVHSTKGVGTKFELTLSFDQVDETEAEAVRENVTLLQKSIEKAYVMVVEDNVINRLVVRNHLMQLGIKIVEAENGLEAIKHPEISKVDLILMDIQMPVMNGIDATLAIRNKLGLHVPIIALTANAVKTDLDKCLDSGMNDYLLKPFEEDQFIAILKKHLSIQENPSPPSHIEQESNLHYNLTKLKLIAGHSGDFLREIIDLFIEKVPEDLIKLQTALAEKDFSALKSIAHKIKPTLNQFGFDSISDDIVFLNYFDENDPKDLNQLEEKLNKVSKILTSGIAEMSKENLL
jgi:PAS domain S-box-containing protein